MRHDLKLDQIHCTGSLEELKTPPARSYVSLKEPEPRECQKSVTVLIEKSKRSVESVASAHPITQSDVYFSLFLASYNIPALQW